MASITMAQAVLNHAHDYYNIGNWHVVAECWDTLAILEELDQQEVRTARRFELEDAAISHFHGIMHQARGKHWSE